MGDYSGHQDCEKDGQNFNGLRRSSEAFWRMRSPWACFLSMGNPGLRPECAREHVRRQDFAEGVKPSVLKMILRICPSR